MNFLKNTLTILIVFIGLKAVSLWYAIFSSQENTSPIARSILFLVYLILSALTLKQNRIATLIMSSILLLSGIGGIIPGIFLVPMSQYFLKSLFIIGGAYFTFGSFILFKSTRNANTNGVPILNDEV